jgi:hypothetical protein
MGVIFQHEKKSRKSRKEKDIERLVKMTRVVDE